jgi:hypothetical protein
MIIEFIAMNFDWMPMKIVLIAAKIKVGTTSLAITVPQASSQARKTTWHPSKTLKNTRLVISLQLEAKRRQDLPQPRRTSWKAREGWHLCSIAIQKSGKAPYGATSWPAASGGRSFTKSPRASPRKDFCPTPA